jgi:hypothetical protein
MTTNKQNKPVNNNTTEAVTATDLGTASALVLSLAPYVSADDVGLDRKQFLRLVAGRILDDLGI